MKDLYNFKKKFFTKIVIFIFLVFITNSNSYAGFTNPQNYAWFEIKENGVCLGLKKGSPRIRLKLKNLSNRFLNINIYMFYACFIDPETGCQSYARIINFIEELKPLETFETDLNYGSFIKCHEPDNWEIAVVNVFDN